MGLYLSVFGWSTSDLEKKRDEIFKNDEQRLIDSTYTDESKNAMDYDSKPPLAEESPDETDSAETRAKLANYKYPFENLVFEGGGIKGLAYCGAIQCMEELNILPQIKRMGGSSAGAITAALLALGYNAEEITKFMSENFEYVLLDHSYGYFSLLPNIIRRWGWNPGNRVYQWFGDKIKAKTVSNNPDLTFCELYKEKQIELCVVVTNLNQMRSEFCHPKTTPNMPIREALRMSMSMPIVFMARMYDNNGQTDTYVDGGVLCNYPIQCFDGWFLSMEKEDSFFLRMQNLNELSQMFSVKGRFKNEHKQDGEVNKKTLGFLVYDSTEAEIMRNDLDSRKGAVKPDKPETMTKLYREKMKTRNIQNALREETKRCHQAARAFMKALNKYNIQGEAFIDKDELRKAIEDESLFTTMDREVLFGRNISVDEVFNNLDTDRNGQLHQEHV